MINQTPLNVIIADDHPVFRYGLKTMLEKDGAIHVLAEAANGEELLQLIKQFKPHVVLTDMIMPVLIGIEAIRKIKEERDAPPCIALSSFNNEHLIVEALEAGAKGYVIKNAEKGEIAAAVQTVFEGHPYYCKSTTAKVTALLIKSPFNPYAKMTVPFFTEREKEIIRYICQEKTSEEISKLLCIGVRTIENDRTKILEKMNVKTSAGVVIYAIKNFLYHIG
ncbi:response regulator transcription factor [soil metagenome]